MKKTMYIISFIFTFLTIILIGVYHLTYNSLVLTMSITSGTILYHFVMRLIVGNFIDFVFHNDLNYHKWWFKVKKWEIKFYNFIKVKSWKKHIPTFSKESFVFDNDFERLIKVTCQAEIVHEIIMLFSFVPIIMVIWVDSLLAFLITSILSCLFDSIFVILQRFNRARLFKVLKK